MLLALNNPKKDLNKTPPYYTRLTAKTPPSFITLNKDLTEKQTLNKRYVIFKSENTLSYFDLKSTTCCF